MHEAVHEWINITELAPIPFFGNQVSSLSLSNVQVHKVHRLDRTVGVIDFIERSFNRAINRQDGLHMCPSRPTRFKRRRRQQIIGQHAIHVARIEGRREDTNSLGRIKIGARDREGSAARRLNHVLQANLRATLGRRRTLHAPA